MNKTLLAAAIATAFALPALAHDETGGAPPAGKHEVSSFELDLGSLLAEAGGAAEMVRAQTEAAREWVRDFSHDIHESMAFMFSDRVGRGKVVKGAPTTCARSTSPTRSRARTTR